AAHAGRWGTERNVIRQHGGGNENGAESAQGRIGIRQRDALLVGGSREVVVHRASVDGRRLKRVNLSEVVVKRRNRPAERFPCPVIGIRADRGDDLTHATNSRLGIPPVGSGSFPGNAPWNNPS